MSEKEITFFNQLAQRWDDLRCADGEKITTLVTMTGIQPGDSVLDVGCGTGVLLPFLSQAVGESGSVTAIDFAANMVARAAEKHTHLHGINYIIGDILAFEPPQLFDQIICFNFFPHINDKPAFAVRMNSLLNPGGALIIMHDLSRQAVNAVHKTSEVVKNDRLPASEKVAEMLQLAGYSVLIATDNDEYYFIRAVKSGGDTR